ncbi:MAG: hypothetical protein NVSMB2_26870 [Chloroflexota bacterium]
MLFQLFTHQCVRGISVATLAVLALVSPVAAQGTPPPPLTASASLLPAPAIWVVNFDTIKERVAPAEDAEELATLRQYTYLDLRGYDGQWAQVFNPRTKTLGYVPSDALGPTDPPPDFVTAAPPPVAQELDIDARAISGAALTYFPTSDPYATSAGLGHNALLHLTGSLESDNGDEWYRTSDGDYVLGSSVRTAKPPTRTFSGRWIDVDLNEPAMLVAYQDDAAVLTTLSIHGVGRTPTPVGVFRIQRRVANETMNSDTIGIPRFSPRGYYLTNVLFTQYFTGDGASIHYNYWSGNWGYGASHGCLGLTYADSAFLWTWAGLGVPVSIHY